MSDIGKKILITAAGLAVAMILLEGLSWLTLRVAATNSGTVESDTMLFDAHRDHRLNPAAISTGGMKLHSADGFRSDAPVALAKAPGTLRIIALGTSALYGLGATQPYPPHRPLTNGETITFHIQCALNDRLAASGLPVRVEVINAGVSAYQTFHHVVHMLSKLVYYKPDMVINIDGHNDFYGDKPTDKWNSYSYSTTVLVDEMNGRSLFLPALAFVRALAPHSNFFTLVEKVAKRYWQSSKVQGNPLANTPRLALPNPQDRSAAIGEFARQTFLRDFTVISDLGRQEGYAHMVFAQPEVVLEDDQQLSEADRAVKKITLDNLTGPDQAQLMRDVSRQLPALFAERGLDFHDLSRIAGRSASGKPLYVDYCHLSPEGAMVLGEAIAEIMAPKTLELARSITGKQP